MIQVDKGLETVIEEMRRIAPEIEDAALFKGASVLKLATKDQLIKVLPAATKPSPKYDDVLTDAILYGKPQGNDQGKIIKISILGNRNSKSGTFRLRFFENGTKDRYQKTYAGKKLHPKRFLGHINALNFFHDAVVQNEQQVAQAMEEIINKKMSEIQNG